MRITKSVIVALLVILSVGSVLSQTKTPRVDRRERRQQARIQEGVQSGQLTGKEAGKLEAQQGKIEQDKMQAKADGTISPAERMKLRHEQNRANRNIRHKKHNKPAQE